MLLQQASMRFSSSGVTLLVTALKQYLEVGCVVEISI